VNFKIDENFHRQLPGFSLLPGMMPQLFLMKG